jgi:hypothetical protein
MMPTAQTATVKVSITALDQQIRPDPDELPVANVGRAYKLIRQSPLAWWAFEGFLMSVAGCDCGDSSNITVGVELGHGGFGEVAAVGDLPFVVDVRQHGADEADDGGLVGEDPTTRARGV